MRYCFVLRHLFLVMCVSANAPFPHSLHCFIDCHEGKSQTDLYLFLCPRHLLEVLLPHQVPPPQTLQISLPRLPLKISISQSSPMSHFSDFTERTTTRTTSSFQLIFPENTRPGNDGSSPPTSTLAKSRIRSYHTLPKMVLDSANNCSQPIRKAARGSRLRAESLTLAHLHMTLQMFSWYRSEFYLPDGNRLHQVKFHFENKCIPLSAALPGSRSHISWHRPDSLLPQICDHSRPQYQKDVGYDLPIAWCAFRYGP
jgi:hypothetical protein